MVMEKGNNSIRTPKRKNTGKPIMKPIDMNLIKLIEEYAGSLEAFSDIEGVGLYHDLSIYGDDADELLSKYSSLFNVSMDEFHFDDYFPEEGDPIFGLMKGFFTGKEKMYKRLTVGDLQEGIINKKIS